MKMLVALITISSLIETCVNPVGHIVLSRASIKCWHVTEADVKAAFLKTGNALRDVYVIHRGK